jgi:23S rRNA pseudouridine2605 synthase
MRICFWLFIILIYSASTDGFLKFLSNVRITSDPRSQYTKSGLMLQDSTKKSPKAFYGKSKAVNPSSSYDPKRGSSSSRPKPPGSGDPKKPYASKFSSKNSYQLYPPSSRPKRRPFLRKPSTPSITTQEQLLDAVKIDDEERLQKVIARAGIASRREAEKYILDGRVTVNGKLVTVLGTKIQTKKDVVAVDGKKISIPKGEDVFWVAVHKPKSVISSVTDREDRDSILGIVPKAKELRLIPVGGLDRDATGLLLMTNDIGWIHPLTHPSFRHHARYEVVVKGLPSEEEIEGLRSGKIKTAEEEYAVAPCTIELLDVDKPNDLSLIDVSLDEVIPKQIEKMFESINCEIIRVKRTEYATIKLRGIRRGAWRELSSAEINSLKESCKAAVKRIQSSGLNQAKIIRKPKLYEEEDY